MPGPDQTVAIGGLVALDGGASNDADGNPLTYEWSLLAKPATSTAVLAGANTGTPGFTADANGDYVVQLIVNDGLESSAGDTVLISTINSAPVANAGPDQAVRPGTEVVLDGQQSSDPDSDPLSFDWALTTRPAGSSSTLDIANLPVITFTPDQSGLYVVQLIVNDGRTPSAPDTASITARDNVPTVGDDTASVAEDSSVTVAVLANDTDPLGGTLTPAIAASPLHGTAEVQGAAIVYAPAPELLRHRHVHLSRLECGDNLRGRDGDGHGDAGQRSAGGGE